MFKKTLIALSLVLFVFAASAVAVDAKIGDGVDQLKNNLGNFGENTGLGDKDDDDLKAKIVDIVNVILGFVGLLAVIVIIYAGFKWITASGNEEQVTDAKGNIRNAVIGIVVIMLSYAIISFAVTQFGGATGAGGGGGDGAEQGGQVPAPEVPTP